MINHDVSEETHLIKKLRAVEEPVESGSIRRTGTKFKVYTSTIYCVPSTSSPHPYLVETEGF